MNMRPRERIVFYDESRRVSPGASKNPKTIPTVLKQTTPFLMPQHSRNTKQGGERQRVSGPKWKRSRYDTKKGHLSQCIAFPLTAISPYIFFRVARRTSNQSVHPWAIRASAIISALCIFAIMCIGMLLGRRQHFKLDIYHVNEG